MAMCYLRGQLGVKINMNLGHNYLQRASATSDPDCPQSSYVFGLIQLGEIPEVASPNPLLPENAGIDAMERAAWLGFAPALVRMGMAWQGGEKGYESLFALRYFLVASRQQQYLRQCKGDPTAGLSGSAEAEISKWMLCGSEEHFEPNEEYAFYFAKLASEFNNSIAEFAVGYFYEVGIYVEQDISLAKVWYDIAASHGSSDAKTRIEALALNRRNTITKQEHKRTLTLKGRGSVKNFTRTVSGTLENNLLEPAESASPSSIIGTSGTSSAADPSPNDDIVLKLNSSSVRPRTTKELVSPVKQAQTPAKVLLPAATTIMSESVFTSNLRSPESLESVPGNFSRRGNPMPLSAQTMTSQTYTDRDFQRFGNVGNSASARPRVMSTMLPTPQSQYDNSFRRISSPVRLYDTRNPATANLQNVPNFQNEEPPAYSEPESHISESQNTASSVIDKSVSPAFERGLDHPNRFDQPSSPRSFNIASLDAPHRGTYNSTHSLTSLPITMSLNPDSTPSLKHSDSHSVIPDAFTEAASRKSKNKFKKDGKKRFSIIGLFHKDEKSKSSQSSKSSSPESISESQFNPSNTDLPMPGQLPFDKKNRRTSSPGLSSLTPGSHKSSESLRARPTSSPSRSDHSLLATPVGTPLMSGSSSTLTVTENPESMLAYPPQNVTKHIRSQSDGLVWSDGPRSVTMPTQVQGGPRSEAGHARMSSGSRDLLDPPPVLGQFPRQSSPRTTSPQSLPSSRAQSPSRTSTMNSSGSSNIGRESMASSSSSLRSDSASPAPRSLSTVMVFHAIPGGGGAKTFEEMGIPKAAGKQKEDCIIM